MPWKILFVGKDGKAYAVDELVFVTRPSVEEHNHKGEVFSLSGSIDDLDQVHSFDVLIQTQEKELHMIVIQGSVSGIAHGYIYEGTTFTAAGDILTPICTNRTLAFKSGTICSGGSSETSGMVITSNGTLLDTTHFAADQKRGVSATEEILVELIFRRHTTYMIRLDNEHNADIQVTNQLVWIEK